MTAPLLAVRGVNLTRIESRPTGERLGRYVFFLDCTGHVAEARLGEALAGLRRICADVRFLGSYPRHRWTSAADRAVPAPAGLSDVDFRDAAAWLARISMLLRSSCVNGPTPRSVRLMLIVPSTLPPALSGTHIEDAIRRS